jgi:hypothetical protein
VLGTNCVDNGPREGLDKFLKAASKRPGEGGTDSWPAAGGALSNAPAALGRGRRSSRLNLTPSRALPT